MKHETKNHPLTPGTPVVISYNPHALHAVNVVGIVAELEIGGGFMGCDIAWVAYADPKTGKYERLPFADTNLCTEPARYEEYAISYEREAQRMRDLAEEMRARAPRPERAGDACDDCDEPGVECQRYDQREDALVMDEDGDLLCEACDERRRKRDEEVSR